MYKTVLQNILGATFKKGLLRNSFKSNNAILYLMVNNYDTDISSIKCMHRNYSRNSNEKENLINSLTECNEKSPKISKSDIAVITLNKNDELAEKKLNEFRQNPENEKKYKTLELELDWWRQENRPVPEHIRPYQMLELLHYNGLRKRKYLRYLFIKEKRRNLIEKKKIENKTMLEEFRVKRKQNDLNSENDELAYCLTKNTMFLRVYPKTMNLLYNNNVLKSMMFGNKIIFDCDYDKYMSPSELASCAKQLVHAISCNRMHDRPFDIHLCNAHEDSKLLIKLKQYIPILYETDYPLTVSKESYLDIFDNKSLCYLTPHCRNDLVQYDPNTIYIIGAFVDKSTKEPISLAKAKREGIRMAKLPLELFINWGSGSSKNLTLNSCLNIMLDIQIKDNWKKAMSHIPTRKLKSTREYVKKHNLIDRSRQKQKFNYNRVVLNNIYNNYENNTQTRKDQSFNENSSSEELNQQNSEHQQQVEDKKKTINKKFHVRGMFKEEDKETIISDFSYNARMQKNWNK